MGRGWVSEPGNLYATFLFAMATNQQAATQLSFVAALAVHDMVVALRPGWHPRIKWPNDVLVDGAKFCGILAEVVGTAPTALAIGCGVNVDHAPQGTAYKVTYINSTRGMGSTVESVLQHLDLTLSNRLQLWDEGRGFPAIREAWLASAYGAGGQVAASGGVSGTFTSIAADGALIVTLADGTTRQIHSGEVRFAELERLRQS